MLAEVRNTIRRYDMFPAGAPVWVAVSGGIDSMVLLHVLRSLGYSCRIAHVDFELRGKESDEDHLFVRDFAQREQLPFRSVRVDPRNAPTGVSIQMAARELRYAWFKELLQEGPAVLALGHHRDDALETLLLNLVRGMGAQGWRGMPPLTLLDEGCIGRPLLDVGRTQIAAYALEHGVTFREDASNADPKYLRNRVRHELLPMLENLRPGARSVLARNAALLAELSKAAASQLAMETKDLVSDGDGVLRIPLSKLRESAAPHLFLMELVSDFYAHPDLVEQVLTAVDMGHTGAQFAVGGQMITLAKDHLAVHGAGVDSFSFAISVSEARFGHHGPFQWKTCLPGDVEFPLGMHTVWLDLAKLQFPLVIRPWQKGDRMRPIGLGGSKLVSDILIDAGVPRYSKHSVHVLLSGGEAVWLAGYCLADGFSPGPRTEKLLRLDFRGQAGHRH
jgi:tRNA(Ile)-lysidine synthase